MISHRMISSALLRLVKCTWGRFVIRWPQTGRCGGRAQGVASGDDRKVPRPQTIVAVMPGSLPLALPSRQAPGLTSRTSIFHLGLRIARNSQKLVHQKQKNQKRFLYGLVELCFAVHYESRSGRARELVAREPGAQKARARNRNRADTREADGRHQSGPLRGWRSLGVHKLDPAAAVWPRRHQLAQRLQGTGGRYRSARRPSICRTRQPVSLLS